MRGFILLFDIEEERLKAFEKRMLKIMFGRNKENKRRKAEFHK
jgi:hypothetical protein